MQAAIDKKIEISSVNTNKRSRYNNDRQKELIISVYRNLQSSAL